MAYLTNDVIQQNDWWAKGTSLLDDIGVEGWLASLDKSVLPFISTLT